MSNELLMLSNHFILCYPFSSSPQSFFGLFIILFTNSFKHMYWTLCLNTESYVRRKAKRCHVCSLGAYCMVEREVNIYYITQWGLAPPGSLQYNGSKEKATLKFPLVGREGSKEKATLKSPLVGQGRGLREVLREERSWGFGSTVWANARAREWRQQNVACSKQQVQQEWVRRKHVGVGRQVGAGCRRSLCQGIRESHPRISSGWDALDFHVGKTILRLHGQWVGVKRDLSNRDN